MKRQVAVTKKSLIDEAERSPVSERKRMKFLPTPDMQNQTVNDSDSNFSNVANQANGSKTNMQVPSVKDTESLENGSHSEVHLNGSPNNNSGDICHSNVLLERNVPGNEDTISIPANLEDESIMLPFQSDALNTSPPDLEPEIAQNSSNATPEQTDNISIEMENTNELEQQSQVLSSDKVIKNSSGDLTFDKVIDCKDSISTSTQISGYKNMCSFEIEDLATSQLKLTRLGGHSDVVFCVDVDEEIIVSSSGDTTIKVWDVLEAKEISNFAGHTDAVTSVILLNAVQSKMLASKVSGSETSRIAVSTSMDSHIRLWSLHDGTEISSIYTYNSIMCIACFKNSTYVVIGTEGGKIEVWDLLSAKLVNSTLGHTSSVLKITVNDCYVYSVSDDGAVKVFLFDDEELQPLYTRKRKQMSDSSELCPTQWKAVAEHNDMLFLGDNTYCLKVLNWRIGQLKIFRNQLESHGICEAIFAKDNILLTSFYDSKTDSGGINIWQLPNIKYVCSLSGDVQDICSLSLSSSENKLRIVSGGHQLLVWDFDLTKPASDNSENFFVTKMENIGMAIEENLEAPSVNEPPKTNGVSSPSKSWCNIC